MPMTYPVVFLSHRSGLLSGYLGNRVRMLGILEIDTGIMRAPGWRAD